jgi:hypothetical protein
MPLPPELPGGLQLVHSIDETLEYFLQGRDQPGCSAKAFCKLVVKCCMYQLSHLPEGAQADFDAFHEPEPSLKPRMVLTEGTTMAPHIPISGPSDYICLSDHACKVKLVRAFGHQDLYIRCVWACRRCVHALDRCSHVWGTWSASCSCWHALRAPTDAVARHSTL